MICNPQLNRSSPLAAFFLKIRDLTSLMGSSPRGPDGCPNVGLLLWCFFISGSAGLIYQVAWSKSLGLVFGHTVYAVATVLAAFMAGLALGSAVLGRWGETFPNALALYGWLELAAGVAGALSLAGIAGVRELYVVIYPAVGTLPIVLLLVRFVA